MSALDIQSVLAIVRVAQERTAHQAASLEAVVAAIIEGSELTSTDDEHDPEGATIAYEQAQATASVTPSPGAEPVPERNSLSVTHDFPEQEIVVREGAAVEDRIFW